jgi:hypothetical protein
MILILNRPDSLGKAIFDYSQDSGKILIATPYAS